MWWPLALVASAEPGAPARPAATAVRLIGDLYLKPGDVRPRAMLLAAGRELEDRVPWLLVSETPEGLALRHGEDPAFATVPWPTLDTLAGAIEGLAAAVAGAGWPVPGDAQRMALAGMAEALDPHSRVLTDERLDRFNVRLTGTLVGIGASFDLRHDEVVVAAVQADGPAARAALRPGDRVLRIDGRSTKGMPLSEVSRRVRGDAGTPVTLRVARDDQELDVVPTRAEVVVPNVTSKVLDGGVGYVAIDHVSQKTVENLLAAMAELDRAGAMATGLVIDLRGNTGGSMKESARLADLFVESGELLRTEGRGGGPVENLQARMVARDDGTEPPIPLVVLVDERTASGAEILAGALLELDRAVLVGRRTYGKGTVQKIYDLDDEARLKLTVARYVLAHGRVLTAGGIVPDLTVGRLYDYGTHLETFLPDETELGVAADDILWGVRPNSDLALEVARRVALAARGPDRSAGLAALRAVAADVRAEERASLEASLVGMAVDWSPPDAPPPPDAPALDPILEASPVDGDTWRLTVGVRAPDDAPLHQVSVELASDTAGWWDGVHVPLGLVPAGELRTRSVDVDVDPGTWPRVDEVVVRVRSAGRAAAVSSGRVLPAAGPDEPLLRMVARLLPAAPGAVGPGGGPVRAVEISLQNLDRADLSGVEVHLGYPETEGVELVDWGVRAPRVPGRSEHVFTLATEVPATVEAVPLEVTVSATGFGDLVTWPVTVPASGEAVALQAPRIERPAVPTHAPAGPWTVPLVAHDDGSLRHLVVWVDGAKVSWTPGDGGTIAVAPRVTLAPGPHRVTVQAVDDAGLSTHRSLTVHADAPAAVAAGPE
jgi:C-terminal peptidase prc